MIDLLKVGSAQAELSRRGDVMRLAVEQILGGILVKFGVIVGQTFGIA